MNFRLTNSAQSVRMIALLAILLFACGLILWHAFDQQSTVEQERTLQVKTSLDGAALEISQYLKDLGIKVSSLSQQHHRHIQTILENPLDLQEQERLVQLLRKQIPELFSLTLANNKGVPLLEDYQGIVTNSCRSNLRQFALEGTHPPIEIYPGKAGDH